MTTEVIVESVASVPKVGCKAFLKLKPRQIKGASAKKQSPTSVINKRASLDKKKQRKKTLRRAGAKSRFPSTVWDLIKKQAGCVRLRKEAHALLEQIVRNRMKAVLSRTLVISTRKMLHAADIHTALDSMGSAVAI